MPAQLRLLSRQRKRNRRHLKPAY